MNGRREKEELTELKEAFKKAEACRDTLFETGDSGWKLVQEQINKLEDQKLLLMQQMGKSHLPALLSHPGDFALPCMANIMANIRNLSLKTCWVINLNETITIFVKISSQ